MLFRHEQILAMVSPAILLRIVIKSFSTWAQGLASLVLEILFFSITFGIRFAFNLLCYDMPSLFTSTILMTLGSDLFTQLISLLLLLYCFICSILFPTVLRDAVAWFLWSNHGSRDNAQRIWSWFTLMLLCRLLLFLDLHPVFTRGFHVLFWI